MYWLILVQLDCNTIEQSPLKIVIDKERQSRIEANGGVVISANWGKAESHCTDNRPGNHWGAPGDEPQGRFLGVQGLFRGHFCFCNSSELHSDLRPRYHALVDGIKIKQWQHYICLYVHRSSVQCPERRHGWPRHMRTDGQFHS